MLYIALLILFGRIKVEAVTICYKKETFLINVSALNHITVHSIVLDEIANPSDLQKLVIVSEKELKVEMKFLIAPYSPGPE